MMSTWRTAPQLSFLYGREPPLKLRTDTSGLQKVDLEASNVFEFNSTTFCGCQDVQSPTVSRILIQYYREQFHRIPLWPCEEHRTTKTAVISSVKTEPVDDHTAGADASSSPSSLQASSATVLHRTYGILTATRSTVGDETTLPWELQAITHVDEDDEYVAAFAAMQRHASATVSGSPGWLQLVSQAEGGGSDRAREEEPNPLASPSFHDHQTLSLYTKLAAQFTGVYAGMAVGVVGEAFQRSSSGALIGVLVREFVTPHYPLLPWRRLPTPSLPTPAAQRHNSTARIHFCSGPFPREHLMPVLQEVLQQALLRAADLLIIGGPLVLPFGEDEKSLLPLLETTFPELLESYTVWLEEAMAEYYRDRPNVPHLKVLLVPHRDDATQIPVFPTAMYALKDGDDVITRSNPCRIVIGGVHVSVCNEDVIGRMQREMRERWPTVEGNLRRVVEAVVQSRCFFPLHEFPSPLVDLKRWERLRLDYIPLPPDDGDRFDPRTLAETKAEEEGAEPSLKRWKAEEPPAESMPHILLMPSSRPAFGIVTHQGVPDAAAHWIHTDSNFDNPETANGVLVVNQEVWSRRSNRRKFDVRVSEISIYDTSAVQREGVTTSNVSCALLHVYNDAVSR